MYALIVAGKRKHNGSDVLKKELHEKQITPESSHQERHEEPTYIV
jgi:hypothetical protein